MFSSCSFFTLSSRSDLSRYMGPVPRMMYSADTSANSGRMSIFETSSADRADFPPICRMTVLGSI